MLLLARYAVLFLLIYYDRSNVLSMIRYCYHCHCTVSLFHVLFLILDTEYDIGREELYHCVSATNRYDDIFSKSFAERIITWKRKKKEGASILQNITIEKKNNNSPSLLEECFVYPFISDILVLHLDDRVANIRPISDNFKFNRQFLNVIKWLLVMRVWFSSHRIKENSIWHRLKYFWKILQSYFIRLHAMRSSKIYSM